MKIKNYPQFSKKSLFLGVDRKYFFVFMIIQTPIYFVLSLSTTGLIPISIIVITFLISVTAFAKDNYFLEKLVIPFALKIKNILPR